MGFHCPPAFGCVDDGESSQHRPPERAATAGRLARDEMVTVDPSRTSEPSMPRYLQLEVSLLDITPRIWRRLLLRETATFNALSLAILDAGPWQGYHLWEFCELGCPATPSLPR